MVRALQLQVVMNHSLQLLALCLALMLACAVHLCELSSTLVSMAPRGLSFPTQQAAHVARSQCNHAQVCYFRLYVCGNKEPA
jgi:hypothetical protein